MRRGERGDTTEMHERPGIAHRAIGGRRFDGGGRLGRFLFVTQDHRAGFIADFCAEVLRAANDFLESARFAWHIAEGLSALRDISTPDLAKTVLVLVGGSQDPWRVSEPDARLLKSRLRDVGHLCVVGAGIFLPLSAGLLNGRQISVHPGFRAAVSEATIPPTLSGTAVTHENHLSSATGPVAAAAMIVNIVGLNAGAVVERSLEAHLGLQAARQEPGSVEQQRLLHAARGNTVVAEALQIMAANLEDPLTIRQIADQIPSSPRHLERCCQHSLGLSPIQMYRSLQLCRARQLLTQTDISITEVSLASGFGSTSKMAKWYRRRYGEPPLQARKLALCGRGAPEKPASLARVTKRPGQAELP